MAADSSSGLQIIGAGLPRTATTSLQAALEQLGYAPCQHMTGVVKGTYGLGDLWAQALQTKDKSTRQAFLRRALEPYRAAVDVPCCLFVEDLIEMYPHAKVIHSVRKSPEAWLKSYVESIGILQDYQLYWLLILHPQRRRYRTFYLAWQKWNKKHFGVPIASVKTYTRHNDEIRQLVPRERMIEFQPGDGWGPLCAFLGCGVPAVPFPRLNDRNALRMVLLKMGVLGVVIWGAVLGGVYLIYRFLSGLRLS